MPHKVFSVMSVAVLTFLVLAIIVGVFSALSDADTLEVGGILKLDLSLIWQLSIQWFNILLLTFALMHILYNPVRKFMVERTERIKSEIDSAKRINQDALEHKAKYEKLIANIEKEKEEIFIKAHRAAVAEADRVLFEAQEAARDLIQKANDEIKLERENTADEIRRQIIEVSALMASRFIETSIDSQTHNRLIDEALADWSEQKWQA